MWSMGTTDGIGFLVEGKMAMAQCIKAPGNVTYLARVCLNIIGTQIN